MVLEEEPAALLISVMHLTMKIFVSTSNDIHKHLMWLMSYPVKTHHNNFYTSRGSSWSLHFVLLFVNTMVISLSSDSRPTRFDRSTAIHLPLSLRCFLSKVPWPFLYNPFRSQFDSAQVLGPKTYKNQQVTVINPYNQTHLVMFAVILCLVALPTHSRLPRMILDRRPHHGWHWCKCLDYWVNFSLWTLKHQQQWSGIPWGQSVFESPWKTKGVQ